jgi:hypothetical protein
MSKKTLDATCQAGVVTSSGVPVAGAQILSEGVGPSTGILLLDEDKFYYIPKTSPDLKTTIEKLISILTELTTSLTLIDAKPTGGVASAVTPVAALNIVNLTAISAELTALSGVLK